jgi:hypothetical protein
MTNQKTERKSFILHKDSLEILDKLTDEQAGKLFKAIKFYQKTKKIPTLDFTLDLVFTPFLNQFIRDDEDYQRTCEARRIAGSKGGKQKVAKASKSKQKVAKLADSDSKNDSDSDSKKESDSKKPTLQEVKDYCLERKNSVNPEKWINHYESNGWKVGKNSMKNWKACIRTWENSDYNNLAPKNDLLTKLNLIAGFDAFKSIEEGEESVSLYAIDTLKVSALADETKDKIKAQFINKKIILR